MIRLLLTMIFLFPLFLPAETIVVKTKAPQNRNAVFQYRVPKGYDKNRREMYRVLVIFGGRNTDGKADASGRMGWGKWCDDNGIFLVAPGLVELLEEIRKITRHLENINDRAAAFYGKIPRA